MSISSVNCSKHNRYNHPCNDKKSGSGNSGFAQIFQNLDMTLREPKGNPIRVKPELAKETGDIFINGQRIARLSDLEVIQATTGEPYVIIPPDPTSPESIRDVPVSKWGDWAADAMYACGRSFKSEGMTKGEIYNKVKGIFEQYLGKDFLEPYCTRNCYVNPEYGASTEVYDLFRFSLETRGVYEDASTLIEAEGYECVK